jgi:hypothetical protein
MPSTFKAMAVRRTLLVAVLPVLLWTPAHAQDPVPASTAALRDSIGAELVVLVYLAAHGLIGHRFWT